MVSNRSTEEILLAWRDAIEVDQEVGAVSSLSLGESSSLVDGLPGLMACRRLALTRSDVSAPWILAGGGSSLWYLLALQTATGRATAHSAPETIVQPPLTPFFVGADSATVMASHTLQAGVLSPGRRGPVKAASSDLPEGLSVYLAPTIQPGEIARWESLPFAIIEPDLPSVEPSPVDWTAYAAIFLALFLILLALVS